MKILYCIILLISANLYSQDIMRIHTETSIVEFNIDEIEQILFQSSNIKVQSFKILDSEINLKVQETHQVSSEILPSNATNKKVIWTSENNQVASISESGFITAHAEGNSKIYAYTDDQNFVDSVFVIVSKSTSVKLNDDSFKLYPNPTNKILNIQLKNDLPFEIIIVDNLGNQIYSEYNAKSINISNFTTGTYIVYINQNNNFYSYKLIKN